MSWWLALIGLVIWAVGGGLLYSGRGTQAKLNLIRGIPTSPAANVPSLLPGEMVEVIGTLRSDHPLTGEFSGRPCVWYSSEVIREYEERERDKDGRLKTHRRSEGVSSTKESTDFIVEDSSGRVAIHIDGAEVDALKVVDRFEREEGQQRSGFLNWSGQGRRTLGYRYVEHILPVDAPVYVLGAVREDGEIGAPEEQTRERKFLVSYRSEEALERHWGSRARAMGYGAVGAFSVGLVLILVAAVTLFI